MEHLYTHDDPPAQRDLSRAAQALDQNGILAIPSDLNWNFVCAASRPKALDALRLLKPGKPKEQPLALVCSSISMASEYGYIDQVGYRVLKKLWPGPYTILTSSTKKVLRQMKDKRKSVGILVPRSPLLRALVDTVGEPLAKTTIPHRADAEPYRFGYEVAEDYGHGLQMILDLGEEVSGQESTLLQLGDGQVEVLRHGAGSTETVDFLTQS